MPSTETKAAPASGTPASLSSRSLTSASPWRKMTTAIPLSTPFRTTVSGARCAGTTAAALATHAACAARNAPAKAASRTLLRTAGIGRQLDRLSDVRAGVRRNGYGANLCAGGERDAVVAVTSGQHVPAIEAFDRLGRAARSESRDRQILRNEVHGSGVDHGKRQGSASNGNV